MEQIDIFDLNQKHIGIEEKDKAHMDGKWHLTFHCWIVRPNNKILLQLRSKIKSTFADMLDTSAAGHISAGETPEDGIREIKEELGIDVDFARLRKAGVYKEVQDIQTKKGIFYNKEFIHMYFLKDDTALDKYIMQPEEVDGVYEMDITDGFKLFSGETDKIMVTGYNRASQKFENLEVGRERFVNYGTSHYIKTLIMAERVINDEKYIGF